MWLLDFNNFAERFLCYSTNSGVWCERSPVPSIPDVFEYAKLVYVGKAALQELIISHLRVIHTEMHTFS